ncbi:hypothetical protein [Dyella subtropica]|uniref:hypothetical protein n=1 Tax=Dyella subtropica TaxID=2992127 RepID=UPI0022536746|nr:hypothetical protein [Dyella subtropica]
MINQLLQRILRKAGAAMAVLLVTGVMTGQAHAQWQVIDESAITSNHADQALEYGKTVEQYLQMIKQYEAMLTSLTSLNLNFQPVNNHLTLISDPSSQVAQACPGASSLPGMALGALGLDPSMVDGQIVTQQRVICAQIVMLQVDKYNTVAKMLNHMNDYFTGLQNMATTANNLVGDLTNGIGDRQALQNQNAQTQATLSTEMANVEQHLKAVDATIAALKDQQSLLANVALKGSNSGGLGALGGQLIQAGAFAAAFSQH